MGKSSTGLSGNIAAFLAYFFILIGGVIFLILEKSNGSVKFAAKQSILYGALMIIVWILAVIPIVGIVFRILGIILSVGWVILWIFALMGKEIRIPVIAQIADGWSS